MGLGKQRLTRLTVVLFVSLLFVILVISSFGFKGWVRVLGASVPDRSVLRELIMKKAITLTCLATNCSLTPVKIDNF